MELAEIFKALADPNRLRILNLLGDQSLCVCDLEEILKLQQSNLSRHLAKLKQAGLVSGRKLGVFMHYERKPLEEPYRAAIESLLSTMASDPAWSADRAALAERLSC